MTQFLIGLTRDLLDTSGAPASAHIHAYIGRLLGRPGSVS